MRVLIMFLVPPCDNYMMRNITGSKRPVLVQCIGYDYAPPQKKKNKKNKKNNNNNNNKIK